MTLNLISLTTIKAQLGIVDDTYDISLTALIPIVSNDIRRILNRGFDSYILASFNSSSKNIDLGLVSQLRYDPNFGIQQNNFTLGQVVYHPNLPDDTYLETYNPLTGLYGLSATPTDTGDYVYPSVMISQWPTISKMIWYKYSNQNTTTVSARSVQSESFGPVSVTYSAKEINQQYDYPQKLIDDLGARYAMVG